MTDVSIAHHDKTLTLTLSRTNKKNAFTQQMYIDLANAINFVQHDQNTRVIVIQGSHGCFTAGNDMHDFASLKGQELEAINVTEQFMLALMESSLPVRAGAQLIILSGRSRRQSSIRFPLSCGTPSVSSRWGPIAREH